MNAQLRPFRPQFDALEARCLLAAAVPPIAFLGATDYGSPVPAADAQMEVTQDAHGNLVIRGTDKSDRVTIRDVKAEGKTQFEVKVEIVDSTSGQALRQELFRVQPTAFKGNAVTAKSRLFFLGGDGNDTFKIEGKAAKQFSVLADGGAGNDEIWGGWNADLLKGGDGNDQLFGEAGHDILLGEEGNDILAGGTGNDLILGGFGFDAIHGDWGKLNNFSEGLNDRIDAGLDLCDDDVTLDLRCRYGKDQWNPEAITLADQAIDLDRPRDVRAGDPDRPAAGLRFTDQFFAEVQSRKAAGRGWFTASGEEFAYLGF